MPLSLRKVLFWNHRAMGCVAEAAILIMSVTGVLLACKRQIISWSGRQTQPSHACAGRLPMESMLATVTAGRHATRKSGTANPVESGTAAAVSV